MPSQTILKTPLGQIPHTDPSKQCLRMYINAYQVVSRLGIPIQEKYKETKREPLLQARERYGNEEELENLLNEDPLVCSRFDTNDRVITVSTGGLQSASIYG